MAENGNDFEETIDGLAYEESYIEEAGVTIGTDTKGVADTSDDNNPDNASQKSEQGAKRIL